VGGRIGARSAEFDRFGKVSVLYLSTEDMEMLIERLVAERDGMYSGHLRRDGYERPFGRELTARLNYNSRNKVDTHRRIAPEDRNSDESK